MKKHRTAFSYYGGKGRFINKYPPPELPTIIEPFAGGAAYSLKYFNKKVILFDTNLKTCEAWWFIQSKDAVKIANEIPNISSGNKISDLPIFENAPPGLIHILRACANIGTFGQNRTMNTITKIGAATWNHNISKIIFWADKIKHWEILNLPYSEAPKIKATWFIDPPYANAAGKLYKHNNIDFNDLGHWCKSLPGQIIVCENFGANWLPFRSLNFNNCVKAKHITITRAAEAIYHKSYKNPELVTICNLLNLL